MGTSIASRNNALEYHLTASIDSFQHDTYSAMPANVTFSYRPSYFPKPKPAKKSILKKNDSKPKNVSFADSFGLNLHQTKLFDRFEDLSLIIHDLRLLHWDDLAWDNEFWGLSDFDDWELSSHLYESKACAYSERCSSFLGTTKFDSPESKTKTKHEKITRKDEAKTKPSKAPVKLPSSGRCENLFRIPELNFNASCSELCQKHPVKLESLTCHSNYTLSGTVLVRNVCFDKEVCLRITGNHWTTFQEISASYLNAKCHHTDRFSFKTDLKSVNVVPGRRLQESNSTLLIPALVELCVRFVAGSNRDLQFWDNNDGQNYKLYKVSL